VEVDTGTLMLYQLNNSGAVNVYGTALNVTNGGSSVDRHYELANGSRINASLTWAGVNTVNGSGVCNDDCPSPLGTPYQSCITGNSGSSVWHFSAGWYSNGFSSIDN